ncbi:MAG TPA: O-antigen ligase family protein [Chryseosolibacter sp.]
MIEKKDIVNALFVAGFPLYGIGSYVSASMSPSIGYLLSVSPFLVILLFYVVDLLYRPSFSIKVNGWYLVMVVFLVSTAGSLFVALGRHLPETNALLTVTRSILVFIPFQAFVAVQLYNDQHSHLPRLTFISLSLLLLINLIGHFIFGLTNELHTIEGRLSFPFLDGFYSGSCLLAVLSVMLLYFFRQVRQNPLVLAGWAGYLFLNMVLLFYINSRLTTLIFLLVMALLVTNSIGTFRSIFWVSLFTVPILLSTGLLLYRILSLPVFASIFQRVDLIDVTTFNGRAFLWKDALDWLLYDQRGILFGNGFRGHYFLNLVSDVAELWNVKESHHLHLHSTSLEILVSQGLFGYGIFMTLFFHLFSRYRKHFETKTKQAVFFPVAVFLLIIFQVDTFLYMESLGALIFSWLLSFVVMRPPVEESQSNEANINADKYVPDGVHHYSGF